MKSTVIKINLLFFCFFSVQLIAQNIESDLKKIRSTYEAMEKLHVKMEANAFFTEQGKTQNKLYTTVLKKKGDKYDISTDDTHILINDHFMITHQKKQKIIACQKHNPAYLKQQQAMPDVTELLNRKGDEVKYKGLLDGQHFYVIKNEQSPTPVIEMYFEPNTYLVRKLVYHYHENDPGGVDRMELTMNYLDTASGFSDTVFSEKKYVQIDKDKNVKLQKRFDGHHLILGTGLNEITN